MMAEAGGRGREQRAGGTVWRPDGQRGGGQGLAASCGWGEPEGTVPLRRCGHQPAGGEGEGSRRVEPGWKWGSGRGSDGWASKSGGGCAGNPGVGRVNFGGGNPVGREEWGRGAAWVQLGKVKSLVRGGRKETCARSFGCSGSHIQNRICGSELFVIRWVCVGGAIERTGFLDSQKQE